MEGIFFSRIQKVILSKKKQNKEEVFPKKVSFMRKQKTKKKIRYTFYYRVNISFTVSVVIVIVVVVVVSLYPNFINK